MQGSMVDIVTTVSTLLAIFLVLYFIRAKKSARRDHYFMPIIGELYGIVATIYILKDYPGGVDLEKYYQVVCLTAITYLPVRFIFYFVSFLIFKSENILSIQSLKYYYRDKDFDEYFIKDEYVLVRRILRVISVVASVFCIIYTTYIRNSSYNSSYSVWYFPIVATIIIIEIYNFLNGYTKKEYEERFGGDDSRSARFSNFYKVREVLERTFAHEVLTSGTGCEFRTAQEVTNILDGMEESDDRIDQELAEFFKLNGTENIYDADCIIAVKKMLHGQNVVFYNPFYRDLGKYIILPIMNMLLKGKNVLIVVSRRTTMEDTIKWMDDLLYKYGRIRDLWRIEKLSTNDPNCEVGVLSFPQLYDLTIMERNKDFLKDVGFVFCLEPSYILNTGQIGLSILAQQMEDIEGAPIYCVADRIADGLVDTLSHVLKSEFAEVVAAPVARNIYTAIGWNADGDFLRQKLFGKQTKYLGNGIEIASVAIKNQIPKVFWFGERKAPIRDIKWITGQYYPTICGYMNVPIQQQSLYDKIEFVSNIWCVPEEREQFVIAEDEFLNLFSTLRTFLSRGQEQTFVNVLSENYLLRDYMRCNYQMFVSNPDAIPSIVPDYVKSERNTLIKLLYNMSYKPVSEEEILRELHLAGVETEDAFHSLTELLKKYTTADDSIFRIVEKKSDSDGVSIQSKSSYSILKRRFDETFSSTLKTAYYICEDEKEDADYIDAKMFGHVIQSALPGQYLTYEGKYYYVHAISPQIGVILRRASNLYDGRKYYRQIRNYCLGDWNEENIVSERVVMDVQISKICLNFTVNTTGYLEMSDAGNLRTARMVSFSSDPQVGVYRRDYSKKTIMRLRIPESNDRVRFTLCVLLSEVLRSVYPDCWPYLAVVTTMPEDVDGMLNYLIYSVNGCVDEEYIYIIEDSELDLGLIESVEKNLMRLLEIITDFLGWHFEKMREPASADPEIETPEFPKMDYKKRKKFTELFKRVRTLFGIKKEEPDDEKAVEEEQPIIKEEFEEENNGNDESSEQSFRVVEDGEDSEENSSDSDETIIHDDLDETIATSEENAEDDKTKEQSVPYDERFEPEPGEDPDLAAIDGTDIFDESGTEEDNEYLEECFVERGIVSLTKTRYQSECFLKLGYEEIDKRLCIDDVHKYLTVRGFSKNSFRQARSREELKATETLIKNENHCDFCGLPLSGVSFERLDDGRIRCNDCTANAINTIDEMKKIFRQSLSLMENFYGIKIHGDLKIRMTDAKKIASGFGSVYRPSSEFSRRVLGYAQRQGRKYSINIENGSPRMATITTIVHELTHIWQYINWNESAIKKIYPDKNQQDIVYEGMAVWASIQYLYLIGESLYAQRLEDEENEKKDVYGDGYRMYCEKYPFTKDSSMIRYSPFIQFPPL